MIDATGFGLSYIYESKDVISEAVKSPATEEQVRKQLSKLNDTVFRLGDLQFEGYNAFIPAGMLNSARREIVGKLYEAKLSSHKNREKTVSAKEKISFPQAEPYLTASVTTQEQHDACVDSGIKTIYFDNVIRRNQNSYEDREGELLIGGYGGIFHYRDSNPFVTDYSLNVVNSVSCYELYRLGAHRVTLSYDLNRQQIKDLVDEYSRVNDGYPSLEMIVYGRAPLMFTKYCPMKKMGQCGECRKKTYELRDEYGSFPVLSHEDCSTTILNGRVLNLLDEMPYMEGIEAFRLSFTTENGDEVRKIVRAAMEKLQGRSDRTLFDQKTDTRGHFNKEIL